MPSPKYLREAVDGLAAALQESEPDLPGAEAIDTDLAELAWMIHTSSVADRAQAGGDLQGARRSRLLDLLWTEVLRRWPEEGRPDGAPPLEELARAYVHLSDTLRARERELLGQSLVDPWTRELLREVAHTLRSPLNSIVLIAQLLRSGEGGTLDEERRRQLGIVHAAAQSLATTVGDLLTITSPAEELRVASEPFTISAVLQAVRSRLEPVAEQKGLRMVVSGPETPRVGPAAALDRILVGLGLYVLDLSDAGEVALAARESGDRKVAFHLRGDGPVPDGVLASLGRVFTTSEEAGVSMSKGGLALTSARRLARSLGTTVRATRSGRQGISFSFEMHLVPAAPGQPASPPGHSL